MHYSQLICKKTFSKCTYVTRLTIGIIEVCIVQVELFRFDKNTFSLGMLSYHTDETACFKIIQIMIERITVDLYLFQ